MSGLFETTTASAAAGLFAQVALEQGLEKPDGLTYIVPPELAEVRVGDRVMVPLGRRDKPVAGLVLSLATTSDVDPSKLKVIVARDRRSVNLPDDLVELARWISRYYCCPLGMVFASLLPAAVKRGTGLVERTYVQLHDPIAAESLTAIVALHKLRGKQAEALGKALELDRQGKLPVTPRNLAALVGARTAAPVSALVEKGLLTEIVKTEVKAIWGEHATEPAKDLVLNSDQQAVLDAIVRGYGGGFGVWLLHGVTGSGKTEVYIRAIEPVVEAGKTAIVLVPEIALTPQTVGRFIGRFKRVAVLHSGLTAAQRHEQWTLIRDGWAQVVVGARSAIFAPVKRLGLVIVDEEHDNSYKQDQAPRYHARDVAIKRAQMLSAAVLLGSATPSLESYHNATSGRYTLLSLPRRVSMLPLPKVEIVDMLEERRLRRETGSGGHVHLLGVRLEDALRRTFTAGGQAMLLLNRRGYANYIACPDHRCGWVMTCDHCDVSMVYHVDQGLPRGGLVRCHYCGMEHLLPTACPVCRKKVNVFGLGTQRVESEIQKKFPDIRLVRMDSDAMRTARDYENALDAFRRGEVHLLIGTQMIAKGLDFPNVRLVGVISADTALSLPDFRATERAFQLVCQVAGRSGRSQQGGRVIVQTYEPNHPAIQLAARHDYLAFAEQEMQVRRRIGLPPVTRMARIVVRDEDHARARREASDLADLLRTANEEMSLAAAIRGPAPAPIARIGGYHREQIEITAEHAATLQKLLSRLRDAGLLRSDAHTAVDVDPTSLL